MERKRASIITAEDENKLWTSGVLGIHNPVDLLNAVFYLNVCLWGVSEHYNLHFCEKLILIGTFMLNTVQRTEMVVLKTTS